ncbi:hypothetical protein BJX61DRAFT_538774 [Aspergillus egyptiacus]|nr:hypothetical protein BJX61DRAFT_538774 [Aspergillus egyptiacus]
MKLSLAVALNLALIATAAPVTPENNNALTDKFAFDSLKSFVPFLDDKKDNEDSAEKSPEDTTPSSPTPNDRMQFPNADGTGVKKPTPVVAHGPNDAAAPTTSPLATSTPATSTPAAASSPAAAESSSAATPSAAATPDSSAEKGPLGKLPVVGGVLEGVTGMLGGGGGAL